MARRKPADLELRVARLEKQVRWLTFLIEGNLPARHGRKVSLLPRPDDAEEFWPASQFVGRPGMPATVKGVREWLGRHSVERRQRLARGGGFEYRTAVVELLLSEQALPPARPVSQTRA